MKNSILYIIGAVALLGGGAFLFLKNKKTKDASKLLDLQNATVGVATKEQEGVKKVEDVINLVEVNDLVKKIDDINNKIDNLKKDILNTTNVIFKKQYEIQINNENRKLVPLIEKLKDLGYTESYGSPVKIR
jgi:LPXTG-motif cell wall-anchored protein